jgi:hypothetical protein
MNLNQIKPNQLWDLAWNLPVSTQIETQIKNQLLNLVKTWVMNQVNENNTYQKKSIDN